MKKLILTTLSLLFTLALQAKAENYTIDPNANRVSADSICGLEKDAKNDNIQKCRSSLSIEFIVGGASDWRTVVNVDTTYNFGSKSTMRKINEIITAAKINKKKISINTEGLVWALERDVPTSINTYMILRD